MHLECGCVIIGLALECKNEMTIILSDPAVAIFIPSGDTDTHDTRSTCFAIKNSRWGYLDDTAITSPEGPPKNKTSGFDGSVTQESTEVMPALAT
jgi:hypothetical protein